MAHQTVSNGSPHVAAGPEWRPTRASRNPRWPFRRRHQSVPIAWTQRSSYLRRNRLLPAPPPLHTAARKKQHGRIGGGAPSDFTTNHCAGRAGGQHGHRACRHSGEGVDSPSGREFGIRNSPGSAMLLQPALSSAGLARLYHNSCHAGLPLCWLACQAANHHVSTGKILE